MSSKEKPKRLGGEFHNPVERRVPRKVIRDGQEVDSPTDELRLELLGESYRADVPTKIKRELFLLAVEKLEPEVKAEFGVGVLESLQRNVLPLYRAGGIPGYQKVLTAWQERWGLGAPWVRDAALTTLQEWQEGWTEPGYYRENPLEWQTPLAETPIHSSGSITTKQLLRGTPERFAYNPLTMSRADAEARFKVWQRAQQRRFEAFLDAQERAAKAAGGQRTKETRQLSQFEWLARFRVLGWNDNRILEHDPEADLMLDAVRKSRERLAEEIGLLLR